VRDKKRKNINLQIALLYNVYILRWMELHVV
jgi:hypothetical protein